MKNILVVEDSKFVLAAIVEEFKDYDDMVPITATSYKEAVNVLRGNQGKIDFAMLDLTLPDASGDKMASLAIAHGIPAIILTGSLSTELRDLVFGKDIVDYILKSGTRSIQSAVKRAHDYVKHYKTEVLIVDDTKVNRLAIKEIMKKINVKVLEASNGAEAMQLIKNKSNNISMIITDYKMPKMDGLELCMQIRADYNKDEFALIAMSSNYDDDIIEKFNKVGVNYFQSIPVNHKKMEIQIRASLELLELFQKTKDLANKDFLTGSFNRRYFFDAGELIFAKAKRKKEVLAVAMLDIDKFKNINDTYGHNVGDVAIKEIHKILDENLRTADLFARFGGEEFCILLDNISLENTQILIEKIRKTFEENIIIVDEVRISYTVSIGVVYGFSSSIDDLVNKSDEALYIAKESGRNRVIINNLQEVQDGI